MVLMSIDNSIYIEYTARFQRDVRALAKRYRNIRGDIQSLLDRLQAGEILGDRVQGIDYTVFKIRVKNSSIQKGKSAGYRVLYYLKARDRIIMITIYSKSDLSDIPAEEIRDILTQHENQ
jgi:mRNA-degrading endonuclease RelE of RelBE toxin-antitoxin system